jgi:flagellar basal body-associated protein FliL
MSDHDTTSQSQGAVMKRRTLDLTLATVGLVVAIVMAIAGGILLYAANFTSNTVSTELSAQKIYFPPADQLAEPALANLQQYAGQQVTTGADAKNYSDMIAVHLNAVAGGKTYSEVSSAWIAGGMKDATLGQQRQTLFMGETLRGILLNTYAFSIFGAIAFIAGIVALIASVVLLALAAVGFVHGRHLPKGEKASGTAEAENVLESV